MLFPLLCLLLPPLLPEIRSGLQGKVAEVDMHCALAEKADLRRTLDLLKGKVDTSDLKLYLGT